MKELIEQLEALGIPDWATARHLMKRAANLLEQQDAEIELLNARWTEWKDSLNSVKEQRNALQAKLSAMEKQEPVGFISPHDLQMLSEGYPRTVVMLAGAKHTEALFTAPKLAQPLTDDQIEQCVKRAYSNVQGRNLEHAFARAIEKAHGIGGQPAPKVAQPLTTKELVLMNEQYRHERAHNIGGQQP